MTMLHRLFIVFFALLLLQGAPALASGGGEKPPVDPNVPLYVEISPFVIPVLGPNGPEEMVSLIVTLELAKGEDRETYVRQRLPRLNDAFVQTLYGAFDRRTVSKGGLIDVALVKAKLMKATERVLGPDYVADVLVQAVAQRKVRGS